MVTILLRLLMIQMTMQFALAANLEGRTAHYVNLLEPTNDDSAQRITCPVFSIRPADKTVKFTKYTASQAQFDVILDWVLKSAQTFKECATVAATDGNKMFMFDDGVCVTSDFLFTRLPEPCEDETATVVYMGEPSENDCAGEYTWVKNGGSQFGDFCGVSNIQISCTDGILSGDSLEKYVKTEGGCFRITPTTGTVKHATHILECTINTQQPCRPEVPENRPAFLEAIKVVAQFLKDKSSIENFMIDCGFTGPPGTSVDFFNFGNGVQQTFDVASEWKTGFPTNQSNLLYAYATPEGLMNGNEEASDHYCCFIPL